MSYPLAPPRGSCSEWSSRNHRAVAADRDAQRRFARLPAVSRESLLWASPPQSPQRSRWGVAGRPAARSRGNGLRGLIPGIAVPRHLHALPFLISDVGKALTVAYVVVSIELLLIAFIRKRFLRVSLTRSLIQVTLGGALVAAVGVIIGSA